MTSLYSLSGVFFFFFQILVFLDGDSPLFYPLILAATNHFKLYFSTFWKELEFLHSLFLTFLFSSIAVYSRNSPNTNVLPSDFLIPYLEICLVFLSSYFHHQFFWFRVLCCTQWPQIHQVVVFPASTYHILQLQLYVTTSNLYSIPPLIMRVDSFHIAGKKDLLLSHHSRCVLPKVYFSQEYANISGPLPDHPKKLLELPLYTWSSKNLFPLLLPSAKPLWYLTITNELSGIMKYQKI